MNEILDSNNLKTTIKQVCSDCWIKANEQTQMEKFWEINFPTSFSISTYHKWKRIWAFVNKEYAIKSKIDIQDCELWLLNLIVREK